MKRMWKIKKHIGFDLNMHRTASDTTQQSTAISSNKERMVFAFFFVAYRMQTHVDTKSAIRGIYKNNK